MEQKNVLYEVDVHMTTSVLYEYMLRHVYMSPTGPLATVVGILLLLLFAKNGSVLYLIAGIIVLVYLPWNLFLSARRQVLMNEAFKKPLHYSFTAEGIYVSQDDKTEMQEWANMYKAILTKKSVIVYTSKINASIFPRADLGSDISVLLGIIKDYMEPKKVKFKQ